MMNETIARAAGTFSVRHRILAFRAGALVAPARTMAMLRVANCPSQDLALTNAAFVNAADAAFVPYAELGDLVLFCKPHDDVEKGTIALNGVQRKLLRVSTGDTLRVEPFTLPSSQFSAAAMTVELEFTKLRTAADLNAAGRHEQVRRAPFRRARSPGEGGGPARVFPAPPLPPSSPAPRRPREGRLERDEHTFTKLELPSQAGTFGTMESGPLGAVANGFP
jgi:hypothetical protein